MGPLPKRKISKGRRDRRRAHDAIGVPQPDSALVIERASRTGFARNVVITEDDRSSTSIQQRKLNVQKPRGIWTQVPNPPFVFTPRHKTIREKLS